MTHLLARILLSIFMLPLAVICWVVTFLTLASSRIREENALMVAAVTTAFFVVACWFLLWRKSVLWNSGRVLRTVLGSIGCVAAGVFAGVGLLAATRIREEELGVFFGTVFGTVVWLPLMVLLWRETSAERAERIRSSAGDVVFCPRCGYNMTGLYEPRCPECGARFTLNQLYAGQHREALTDAAGGEPQAGNV